MTNEVIKYNEAMPGPAKTPLATVPLVWGGIFDYACAVLDKADRLIAEQGRRISALEDLTMNDEMTGLKNRRGLRDVLTRELDLCVRGVHKGGFLVVIDLDNLKMIEKEYGALAAEACVRLVGRALDQLIRTMDAAARLQEDEFIVMLSNATRCEAAARAQDMARQLNNLALAWYGEEIPIQASFGLRSYGAGASVSMLLGSDSAPQGYQG